MSTDAAQKNERLCPESADTRLSLAPDGNPDQANHTEHFTDAVALVVRSRRVARPAPAFPDKSGNNDPGCVCPLGGTISTFAMVEDVQDTM